MNAVGNSQLLRRSNFTRIQSKWVPLSCPKQLALRNRDTRAGEHLSGYNDVRSYASSGAPASGGGSEDTPQPTSVPTSADGSAAAATPSEPGKTGGVFQSIKRFFAGDKLDKERLAALGMGAFASYGVISNVTYGTCMMIAWISFVKAKGVSPLAPGQWPGFLVFYAGLFTFQNIVRPLRFSLAIALAPVFDRIIDGIGAKVGVDKKFAFGILLGIIFVCTCTFVFGGLYLLGGFPPITTAN